MTDYKQLAEQFESLLGLENHAVAIAFRSTAPEGVPPLGASGPAGCSYWQLAGQGQTFYTSAADHVNCTIGAYTHGVPLSTEKSAELEATIAQMIGLGYLRGDEIPLIPHRSEPFETAVYSPLAGAPGDPDVVVVRGNARQVMLLMEASMAAGVGPQAGMMARPTCAFIPDTLASGRATPSFACIGNRVYTGLGDGELYFALPGAALARVTTELARIVEANRALEQFHRGRLAVA